MEHIFWFHVVQFQRLFLQSRCIQVTEFSTVDILLVMFLPVELTKPQPFSMSQSKLFFFSRKTLTKMWTQCVHMKPMKMVPTAPINRPEFLYAIGIAKIPVPKELFNRCANEPISLDEKKKKPQMNSVLLFKRLHFNEEKKPSYELGCDIFLCSNGLYSSSLPLSPFSADIVLWIGKICKYLMIQ